MATEELRHVVLGIGARATAMAVSVRHDEA